MLQPTASSFDVSLPHFKLGDFTDFSLLARGGEGVVEKADHNTLGCVAIKTLFHPVPLEGIKEISILVKSKHPNIVQLFGITTDKYSDRLCGGYVMEFMQLGNLSAIIHNSAKEYDKKQVYLWIEQVGRGLKYLHENNIIHRDIKPQNMLLASIDHLKLADFGISRDIVKGISFTAGCGTCLYMAPEVINTGRYGQPADIYSFAISIWEMIHRQEPYSNVDKAMNIQIAVLSKKRPPLGKRIDPETKLLLQRGWNEKPAKRVTIVEMIEFAKRKSAVNIKETRQLMIKKPLEKNENDMEALQVENFEFPSTILICMRKKAFILSKDKLHWETLSLELPCSVIYGGFAYLNGEIYICKKYITYKFGHQKKWIKLADMNEVHSTISNSTVLFEDCIWVFGGHDQMYRPGNTVEKYIPEEDKWVQMPNMQQSRCGAAAAVYDGKIYVSGGYHDDILNNVECFDPKTNIWTMFVDLPTPLYGHSMISDGSSLIVLGKVDDVCNTVLKINPKEENPTWKTMPSMMEARRYFNAILFENRIYVIGGMYEKTVEIFNGESWEAGPTLPKTQTRSDPVSVVIPSHFATTLLAMRKRLYINIST